MATLADTASVRTIGGLAAAQPSDGQVDAAVLLGSVRLRNIVTEATYVEVLALGAGEQKRIDFVNAESCLAMAALGSIIAGAARLKQTGAATKEAVGQSQNEFASSAEGQKQAAAWEARAAEYLTPYLSLVQQDENGNDVGYIAPDGKFGIMMI